MHGRLVGCSSRTPCARAPVQLAGAGDLEGQQPAHRPVDDAVLEVLAGDAEGAQVLHRQVDPAALQVLADVAQEVAQLERDAEVAGVGVGDLARHERLEHRHHLQPDDRRVP